MSTEWENLSSAKKIKNSSSYINEQIMISENDKLVNKITSKLWISNQVAYELALHKTINSINDLKKELSELNINKDKNTKIDSIISNQNSLKEILEELNSLKFLQNEIKLAAKMKIADLRDWIKLEKSDDYKIASADWISSKFILSEKHARIEAWESIWDNLSWLMFWSIDTAYSLWKYWKDLLVWIAKTPVDLYKIVTWKAEIDSFKNV